MNKGIQVYVCVVVCMSFVRLFLLHFHFISSLHNLNLAGRGGGVHLEDNDLSLIQEQPVLKSTDASLDTYHLQKAGTGPGPGPELPQKMEGSHQLPGIDSTPSAQGSSGGQTKTRETSAAP